MLGERMTPLDEIKDLEESPGLSKKHGVKVYPGGVELLAISKKEEEEHLDQEETPPVRSKKQGAKMYPGAIELVAVSKKEGEEEGYMHRDEEEPLKISNV